MRKEVNQKEEISVLDGISYVLSYACILISLAILVIFFLVFFRVISREIAGPIIKNLSKLYMILYYIQTWLYSIPLALFFLAFFCLYKYFSTIKAYLLQGCRDYLQQVRYPIWRQETGAKSPSLSTSTDQGLSSPVKEDHGSVKGTELPIKEDQAI
jgi:hypothetical protein